MPPWLQAVLGIAGLVVTITQIAARWGGRAQKQDTDGRVLDRVEGAAQRHDVTDATLAQTMAGLARGFERMEAKLDRLTEDHRETREASVRHEAERTADRERLARLEADNASLRGELRTVDERHTAARHALRGEIQGWVRTGIDDALNILRGLVGGDGASPRPSGRR